MVGTLPGRTQGLGLITEPLLRDLAIDRVTYATLNFWATIIGAVGAVLIGHAIDRWGTRLVLVMTALSLGCVVCGMSQANDTHSLAGYLILSRGLGQSALSVVSLAIVGHWFVRRIDTAMAIYSIALSVGFMIAFPLVGSAVQNYGWRTAWLMVGFGLIGVLAPLGWFIVRRRGATVADGGPEAERPLEGYSWKHAMRMPAFWVFAAGTALYGLVASGIGLFNESILAERGFGPEIYYQTLVVTALVALLGNFLGGWAARSVSLTLLLSLSLLILAAGVAALPHVAELWHVIAWAAAMGLGGGLVMVLFFSVWPRAFGRKDLGRIQGAAQALTVLASAVGPLLLALCVESTGSYASMFRLLAGLIAAVAAAGFIVSLPDPPGVAAGAPSEAPFGASSA